MMRAVLVLMVALSLSACSVFGGKKTRLVPQAYMPEPPAVLMRPPGDLKTIKNEEPTAEPTPEADSE
jgi:hypothetical protein